MPAPSSRSCLRVVIVAAVLFVTAVVGVAVWAYREYGPLPIREAPAKHRLPFLDGAETVAYSTDGRRLAAGGKLGIKVWDSATGQVVWEWTQNPSVVRAVRYSPDGGRLAVLCTSGHLTLRAAGTGAFQMAIQPSEPDRPAAFVGPDTDTSPRSSSSACFSPDGRWLATGHYYASFPHGVGGEVRVWEVATGKQVRTIETPVGVMSVAFTPDGRWIVSGEAIGKARMWDSSTGQKVRDLSPGGGETEIAFIRSGREVVYAGGWCFEESPATVLDLNTEATRSLTGGRPGYAVYVRCMAVSADGRRLALGELVKDHRRRGGYRVRVWDLGSGELLADYDWPAEMKALAYSPGGRELAVACGNEVRVCEVP